MVKGKKITIIGGSGKMGRWFARFLRDEGREVTIIGRDPERLAEVARDIGVATSTRPETAGDADVILISVPIDSFEAVVKQLVPHLRKGQVVIDFTSVKTMPVEVMHRHIKEATVLGAHPVFGPGAKSLQDKNFVLTPVNDAETRLAGKIKDYLEPKGARVTLMSPEEHDELMAVILGLAHFIAIASADTLLSFDKFQHMEAVGGSTYKFLLTLIESVISEDPQLYASLQMNLSSLTDIEDSFKEKVMWWADTVRHRDAEGFVRRMTELKEKMGRSKPNFDQSYQDIYKFLEKE